AGDEAVKGEAGIERRGKFALDIVHFADLRAGCGRTGNGRRADRDDRCVDRLADHGLGLGRLGRAARPDMDHDAADRRILQPPDLAQAFAVVVGHPVPHEAGRNGKMHVAVSRQPLVGKRHGLEPGIEGGIAEGDTQAGTDPLPLRIQRIGGWRRLAHGRDGLRLWLEGFRHDLPQLWTQARPAAFQPPNRPRCFSASRSPSNPPAILKQGEKPAAVMALAAARERAPERQMKYSGLPGSAPWARNSSTKRGLILISGYICHDTNKGRFPSLPRSGTPTKLHSGWVRTSISCATGSLASLFQASALEISPAYSSSPVLTEANIPNLAPRLLFQSIIPSRVLPPSRLLADAQAPDA